MNSWRIGPSEEKVLDGLALGKSNSEIAKELGISERTVKAKLNRLSFKLKVEDTDFRHLRIQLAILWSSELYKIGLKELGRL